MKNVSFFVGLFLSFIAIIKAHEDGHSGPSECHGGSGDPCEPLSGFDFDCDCEKFLGHQVMYPEGATDEEILKIQSAYAAICAAVKCLTTAADGGLGGGSGDLVSGLVGTIGSLLNGLLGGGGSSGGDGGGSSVLQCPAELSEAPEADESCALFGNSLLEGPLSIGSGLEIKYAINTLCAAEKCLLENGADTILLPNLSECDCTGGLAANLGQITGGADLATTLANLLCQLIPCVLDLVGQILGG